MSAAEKIKPLRDFVAVKRLEYQHEVLFVAGQKLDKGEVVAVGPGRRMRRRVPFHKFSGKEEGAVFVEDGAERVDDNGKPLIRPMRVKVGDIVEFGFRGQVDLEVDREKFVIIPEQSIYGKTTRAQNVGLFGKKSAGFDKQGRFLA